MSHVVDEKLEQRAKIVSLLQAVENGISGMLNRPWTHWKMGQGCRTLSEEELKGLTGAYFKLVGVVHALEKDASKHDLAIEEVCTSKEMVECLRCRGLHTVMDLHRFDRSLLREALGQCKCANAHEQIHMYLFAGDE